VYVFAVTVSCKYAVDGPDLTTAAKCRWTDEAFSAPARITCLCFSDEREQESMMTELKTIYLWCFPESRTMRISVVTDYYPGQPITVLSKRKLL